MARPLTYVLTAALVCGGVAASCMLPFEDYDPRDATSATTGGTGGTGGTGTTSTAGGSSAAGGTAPGGTGGTAAGGAGGTQPSGGAGGTGGSGGAPILHTEYLADVAECIDPAAPDPAACEAEAGNGNMDVDLAAGSVAPYHVTQAYVRFSLDQAVAGHSVLAATLRLTATSSPDAEGDHTGEVWTVAAFDLASLATTTPAPVVLVSADQGAVAVNQVVDFELPPNLVVAGNRIHLAVLPKSTHGVDYWNLDGIAPPLLLVDYQ